MALLIYKKTQNRALFISLYSTAIRQLCGINYVIFFGNIAFQNADVKNYNVGCFVLSLIQFAFSFLGLFICHRFNRRNVYLIGGLGVIAGALIMAICDLTKNYPGVIAGQVIFIIFISSSVNPLVWPYPI